jgi:hypothetical protein
VVGEEFEIMTPVEGILAKYKAARRDSSIVHETETETKTKTLFFPLTLDDSEGRFGS